MVSRLRTLGMVVGLIGVIAVLGGAYGYLQIQRGAEALQGFSEVQGVMLTYNEDGNLVDRGTEEGAEGILELLEVWPESAWRWRTMGDTLRGL